MPIQSKAQQRWAYANEGKSSKEGAAARDFIAATPKRDYASLPEVKKREAKKSTSRHMSDVMKKRK